MKQNMARVAGTVITAVLKPNAALWILLFL